MDRPVHTDHDPDAHRARGLEIDARVRQVVSDSRADVAALTEDDVADIGDAVEQLVASMPPADAERLLSRLISELV